MDASPKDNGQVRSACTECQRRKQKCNRQWPCNHCQKRKVADRCHFSQTVAASAERAPSSGSRKRNRHRDEQPDSSSDDDDAQDFAAIGYGGAHFFTNLEVQTEKKPKPPAKQHYMAASNCHQLERALQVLPPRTTTDSLVQNFLSRVNYHYYIIYPPAFLQEYREWWMARFASQPLGLQWTCLLLMVCACSTQYTDPDFKRKLEMELGEPIYNLSNKYHNAARELHSVIPISSNHILNVQHLLHSSYWYKSEARFVESWHALSTAIREAQALGIHQDQLAGSISEFDFEMRRRLWCVLDAWDWQISALLSRPKLIDRSECKVSLPALTLESYSPSPLLHMKLQSQVIGELASRFGSPREVTSPAQIDQYTRVIIDWMQGFPSVYSLQNPDTSIDSKYTWVTLHRHYLHTMAYSMLLDPIRAYMARRMTVNSPPNDLRIRDEGITYTMKLMSALSSFFEFLYPRDARFHWALFSIFDTAAVLCSVILHDEDRCISRRQEIIMAIESARSMLARLAAETRTAKTSYEILSKLAKRIENPYMPPKLSGNHHKRARATEESLTPPFIQHFDLSVGSSDVGSTDDFDTYSASPVGSGGAAQSIASASPAYGSGFAEVSAGYSMPNTLTPAYDTYDATYSIPPATQALPDNVLMPAPPNPYMPPTPRESYAQLSIDGFSEEQLGDLAALWNYQSLDLNFVPSQNV
ncbi:Fungal specific transcription factor [Cordyceps javanica]|uniref:Fungal specific transcription factor n=1 Tax=Cordyceps javanica TaxID=43265 RepID=A0A545W882_9HYPO|nr:Fungal specific transcription factor [Cordyceps javanica]TQW10220.1 Fungal specific transcription factor [Cordyceps javanica]